MAQPANRILPISPSHSPVLIGLLLEQEPDQSTAEGTPGRALEKERDEPVTVVEQGVRLRVAVQDAVAHQTAGADCQGRRRGDHGHPEKERSLPAHVGERQRENRTGIHRADQVPKITANSPCQSHGQRDEQAPADAVNKAHGTRSA